MASRSPDRQTAAPTASPPVGYPFHEYLPTRVEPCAVDAAGKSLSFHLLSCGHLVAVDCEDNRCGLNCLHVSAWMTQKLSQQQEDSVDLTPGKSLFQALTFSAARPHHPIYPPQSPTQGHDKLFCEMCHGIPFASYNLASPEHGFRRALSLTRPVIEHFTGYEGPIMDYFLAELFYNPHHQGFDHKYVHHLRCGHEVWCAPFRPCAANCNDMPPCRSRIFPRNVKQGDAILCKECTYRAELVYSRYVMAGGGGAREEVTQDGLRDRAGQNRYKHNGSGDQSTVDGGRNVGGHYQYRPREQDNQQGFDGQGGFGCQNAPVVPDSADGYAFDRSSSIRNLNTSGLGIDMQGYGAQEGLSMFDLRVNAGNQAGFVGQSVATDGSVHTEAAAHGSSKGTPVHEDPNLDPNFQ